MKKFTALLLTFCFAALIVGCSEDTKTAKKTEPTGKSTTATTTTKK